MGRLWRPVLVGAVVVLGTFALAQAQIFEPSAAPEEPAAAGDVEAGAVVFDERCAACHGPGGTGGSGPALANTGLDAAFVTERVREGAGIMPGGLATGQDEADVVAYVVSISSP